MQTPWLALKYETVCSEDDQLYDWQKELVAITKTEPDDQTVHWYWGPEGCGKTAFTKYMASEHNAICTGNYDYRKALKRVFSEWLGNTFIIDMARTEDTLEMWLNIKIVKEGRWYNRNEEKSYERSPSQVIVFSRQPPDLNRLRCRLSIRKIPDAYPLMSSFYEDA